MDSFLRSKSPISLNRNGDFFRPRRLRQHPKLRNLLSETILTPNDFILPLFICDGEAGLKVFDATDVANLKLLQTFSGINSNDVIAMNNLAIVVTADGLYQYDYTNSRQIILKSKIGYGL